MRSLSLPLFSTGALTAALLLALLGCETTSEPAARQGSGFSMMPDKRWTSGQYGYTIEAKAEQAFFNKESSAPYFLEEISAVLLSPASFVGVIPFPLPEDNVSVEAIASGFGRALQNAFNENPGAGPVPRDDLPYPAREYRVSLGRDESGEKAVYYTVIRLPHRALLVAQVVGGENPALHALPPAERFPLNLTAAEEFPAEPGVEAGREPAYGMFLNGIGLYYLGAGNTQQALEFFADAHAADERRPDYLFNAALVRLNRGEPAAVVKLLEGKLDDFPDDVRLQRALAMGYIQTSRHDEGIPLYEQLIADGSYDPVVLGEYFDALATIEDFDQIIEKARPFLEAEMPVAALWSSIAYRERGELEAAAAVVEGYEEDLLRTPETASVLLDLALRQEDYGQAIDYVDEAIELTGNHEMEFYRGIAHMHLGQYTAARDAFEATVAANPGHANAQQFISQVNNILGQTDPSLFRHEVKAVPLAPLLRDFATQADDAYLQKSGAVGEFVGVAIHWEVNEPRRLTRRESFRVRDEDALTRLKEKVLSFDPLIERIYVNRLDVFDPAGELVAQGNPAQFYLSDPNQDSVVNTEKNLHIPIPGLLVGGSYELVVSREYLGPADTMYFNEYCFSGTHPRKLSYLQLSGDTERVAVKVNDAAVEAHETEGTRIWIHPQPMVAENHPMLPDYSDYLPMIWLADRSVESWGELAADYAEELVEVLGEVPGNVRAEAENLGVSEASVAEKVQAVSDLMAEKYAYTALNFGRHATLPHQPADIFRSRFGDCKDLTVVMHHYLKALGVESHPALVKAAQGLVPELPSLDQFDHMVLYIPELEPHPIVDPSDRYMSIGFVPRSVDREPLLVVRSDTVGLLALDKPTGRDNRVRIERDLGVDLDGMIDGRETITFEGFTAADLRGYLSTVSPDDYTQVVQNIIAHAGLSLPLRNVRIPNVAKANEPLVMELHYRLSRQLHRSDSGWVGQLPGSWDYSYFLRPRSDRPRNAPVELHRPMSLATITAVTLPNSWELLDGDINHAVTDETAFGTFARSLADTGGEERHSFSIQSTAEIASGTYAADRYHDLADFFERISEGLTPQVRFATQ